MKNQPFLHRNSFFVDLAYLGSITNKLFSGIMIQAVSEFHVNSHNTKGWKFTNFLYQYKRGERLWWAIVPAARYGTRRLPITKAITKEMFPLDHNPATIIWLKTAL